MAVYKFKISFEDYDDVQRDIEIKSVQTFGDLHRIILQSIGFDDKHDASFYLSDLQWHKGKEIASTSKKENVLSFAKSRLCDFISDPHQRFYYLYDFSGHWVFYIELMKIILKDDPKAAYPRCVRTAGTSPKQYKSQLVIPPVTEDMEDEEEELPKDELTGEAVQVMDDTDELTLDSDTAKEDDEIETAGADSGEENTEDIGDFGSPEGGEESQEESGF